MSSYQWSKKWVTKNKVEIISVWLECENRYVCRFYLFPLIKIFGGHKLAYATLRQSVANLMFRNVSFNFATAISKFDTFSSYHIVRTRIAKVTNFFPFCTIGISMYQKRILPYFIIPSTFSPQASSPLERYGRTDGQISTPLSPLLLSFFHWARRALPAGATQLVDGRLNKTIPAICNTPPQTQCVRNSIFPHFIMVIMLCCGPSCGLWFVVVCWCAK